METPYSKSLNKSVNCPSMSPQILIGAWSLSKLGCWTKIYLEAWSRSRIVEPVYLPSRTEDEKKNGRTENEKNMKGRMKKNNEKNNGQTGNEKMKIK